MKIGIEVQRLFRKKKFGIETSSLELIKAMRKVHPGHEYVLFAKDDMDPSCVTPSENLKVKLVSGKLFADFEQFFLPIAAKREQVDILHCTGNTAPLFSPVPIVQTLHDVIFMDPIPTGDSLYQRLGNHYRRKIVPLVTPRSGAVITVSQYEKERIVKRLGIDPERIHVVYNGIDHDRFHNRYSPREQHAVRVKYNLPGKFMLFLGNEATRKNPGRVIDAYVRYATQADTPLPIVTPGLSDEFIESKLAELNASEKGYLFVAPGYILEDDLPVVYNLSTVFLIPSLSEGFGMPLAEAMACGAPVVTSSTSCLPEIAGNAAVLVNPLSPDDISNAMLQLTNDEELRKQMIDAGLRNSRRFNWTSAAEKILDLYEAVVAEQASSQKQPGFLGKYVFATRH